LNTYNEEAPLKNEYGMVCGPLRRGGERKVTNDIGKKGSIEIP